MAAVSAVDKAQIAKLEAEARSLTAQAATREIDLDRVLAQSAEHDTFTFMAEVTDQTVYQTMNHLGVWSRRYPGRDLKLIINSPGGSVIDGLALYDFLQELKEDHHVTTVTLGMAASMGGILLQAGHTRVAGSNAFLLIHEVSSYSGGKITELKDEAKFLERLEDKGVGILAERSTMTPQKIKNRMARQDWWLDAEEALRLGFVDEIRG